MRRTRHLALLLGTVATAGACLAQAPTAAPEAGVVIRELPITPPETMQYLYGSGEAAALSIGVYRVLVDYAQALIAKRPPESVILAPESTLDAPRFEPCGEKPLAAVFDVDETVIANLGYEGQEVASGKGYIGTVWNQWEKTGADKVEPIPGAVSAMNALRRAGVTIIFNTNRKAENAAQTVDAIRNAGLGSVVHGETLFLAGDDATGSHKDGRRAIIAGRYCVIAMAGDQLGDFTDLFNQDGMGVKGRRSEVSSGWAARLWGAGWFLLPNPVYGTGVKGSFDEVFPADKRWEAPAAKAAQ